MQIQIAVKRSSMLIEKGIIQLKTITLTLVQVFCKISSY